MPQTHKTQFLMHTDTCARFWSYLTVPWAPEAATRHSHVPPCVNCIRQHARSSRVDECRSRSCRRGAHAAGTTRGAGNAGTSGAWPSRNRSSGLRWAAQLPQRSRRAIGVGPSVARPLHLCQASETCGEVAAGRQERVARMVPAHFAGCRGAAGTAARTLRADSAAVRALSCHRARPAGPTQGLNAT